MSVRPRSTKFDPESSGYDELSAKLAGMKRDKNSGHMGSRNPITGQMLKGRRHKSWNLAVQGEKEAGYKIKKGRSGRYYSTKK